MGTAKGKREPSGVTSHSGITPGTANRRFVARAEISRMESTSTDITVPSGFR